MLIAPQAYFAAGLQPARLARIGHAYYFGPQAMHVDDVGDVVSKLTHMRVSGYSFSAQLAASSLIVYWGLCAQRMFGSREMARIWWEQVADWETGRYVAVVSFIITRFLINIVV